MSDTNDIACPVKNALALLRARSNALPDQPLFLLPRGGFERDMIRCWWVLVREPLCRGKMRWELAAV
ncbi:hypothetical protein E4U25_000137 [Claviceps purpurea]|nr:hypothetical protein E4U25_000137 [Claviceps purpurea]